MSKNLKFSLVPQYHDVSHLDKANQIISKLNETTDKEEICRFIDELLDIPEIDIHTNESLMEFVKVYKDDIINYISVKTKF